jgi:hypothetical protein
MAGSINFWTATLAAGSTLVIMLTFSLLFVEPESAAAVAVVLSAVVLLVPVVGSAIVIYVGWRPFQGDDEDEESVFE